MSWKPSNPISLFYNLFLRIMQHWNSISKHVCPRKWILNIFPALGVLVTASWGWKDNGLVFTKETANWVFTSAKNGAESEAMCEECRSAQLPGCEHMTFREFIEAILRCAVILYPLDGMQAPDIDMAPSCTFRKTGKQLAHACDPFALAHSHTSILMYTLSAHSLYFGHLFESTRSPRALEEAFAAQGGS